MNKSSVVALTSQELASLLAVTKKHNPQFYVMFLLSVVHGLRVSEAIKLRRSNFTTAGGELWLNIQRLKGSKTASQKLIPQVREVVTEHIAKLALNDLLFQDKHGKQFNRMFIHRMFHKYGELAGLPVHKLHHHVLKHTCGTLMRQAGHSIETIAESLGHKNINNTRVYMAPTADEIDAARAKTFAAVAGF